MKYSDAGEVGEVGQLSQILLYKTKKKEEGGLVFFFPRAIWDFLPHFPHLSLIFKKNLEIHDRNKSSEGSGVRSGGRIFTPLAPLVAPLLLPTEA